MRHPTLWPRTMIPRSEPGVHRVRPRPSRTLPIDMRSVARLVGARNPSIRLHRVYKWGLVFCGYMAYSTVMETRRNTMAKLITQVVLIECECGELINNPRTDGSDWHSSELPASGRIKCDACGKTSKLTKTARLG